MRQETGLVRSSHHPSRPGLPQTHKMVIVDQNALETISCLTEASEVLYGQLSRSGSRPSAFHRREQKKGGGARVERFQNVRLTDQVGLRMVIEAAGGARGISGSAGDSQRLAPQIAPLIWQLYLEMCVNGMTTPGYCLFFPRREISSSWSAAEGCST